MTPPPRPPSDPLDAELVAAGREVEALAVEIEALQALWPKGETALRRAEIGRALDLALARLAELYGIIANSEAHTLAGAAVMLRRALAGLDGERGLEHRLVGRALGVIELSIGSDVRVNVDE